jgi:hypothetical protein
MNQNIFGRGSEPHGPDRSEKYCELIRLNGGIWHTPRPSKRFYGHLWGSRCAELAFRPSRFLFRNISK